MAPSGNEFVPTSATGTAHATTTGGQAVTTIPGAFALKHGPAANTQATISQAAGGGTVKNVCTGFQGSLASDGAPTPELVRFYLRDGATGAGTIKAEMALSLPAVAGETANFSITGLNIVGTANTAMTAETDSAPGANTYATVAMQGYTLPS